MRRRGLCLCLAALTAAAGRAAADDLADVMSSLAQRRHGEVRYVERQYLSLLRRPLESSGELLYDAPDRLEKRTLEPHPETLLLNGDVLTIERGHRTRVVDLKSYPQIAPFVESIRATLAGDRATLERLFRLQFAGNPARWSLDLVPLDAEVAKTVAEVRISGAGDALLEVEIRQADGDRSLMQLRPPLP
jgi:hypothetical protein